MWGSGLRSDEQFPPGRTTELQLQPPDQRPKNKSGGYLPHSIITTNFCPHCGLRTRKRSCSKSPSQILETPAEQIRWDLQHSLLNGIREPLDILGPGGSLLQHTRVSYCQSQWRTWVVYSCKRTFLCREAWSNHSKQEVMNLAPYLWPTDLEADVCQP